MTAIATIPPATNAIARAPQRAAGLEPGSIQDALSLADMMAKARLVPQHLQGSPADCFLVIEQACRWGLSPFAVAQCTSVIQGKLMFEGKLVAAVINAKGDLDERLSYVYAGSQRDRTVTVRGTLSGESAPREVTVRLADAATSNKMWQVQPDQQLAYHGARVWARRHMPELMLGVYSPEEMGGPAPEARSDDPRPLEALPDPDTGEVVSPYVACDRGIRAATKLADLEALLPTLQSLPEADRAELRPLFQARSREVTGGGNKSAKDKIKAAQRKADKQAPVTPPPAEPEPPQDDTWMREPGADDAA